MCMYVYPLNLQPSKEKKHDFEKVYVVNANKGPTHILKNEKKNFAYRTTTRE